MPYNNELPSYESLLEFQEVYLRAIALAWQDDTFKEKLLADAEYTLEQYFGYKCPWNIDLSVTEASGPEYGWNSAAQRWRLPNNTITIGIPIKPEEDAQAVALAAYNDAGPTYLFTCC